MGKSLLFANKIINYYELQVANEAVKNRVHMQATMTLFSRPCFKGKNVLNQAADDEGYLFGCSCGTAPRDELV